MGYLEGSKLELALRNRLEVVVGTDTVISCGTYLLNSEALGVELGQQGIGDIAFVLEPMRQSFMSLNIRALRNVFFCR